MLLQIEHSLHFSYSDYIRESHMDIRVEPRTQSGQVLLDFSLIVGPTTRVTRHEDWLGNTVHWFSITDYHDRIEVLVRSLVETNPSMILPGIITDPISQESPGMAQWDFMQFVGPVIDSEAMRSLHSDLKIADLGSIGEVVECVGEGLRATFEYRPNVTDAHSTTDALLLGGGGVCQDFAHAALGLLRLSGIPARYVSGYLHVERDDDTFQVMPGSSTGRLRMAGSPTTPPMDSSPTTRTSRLAMGAATTMFRQTEASARAGLRRCCKPRWSPVQERVPIDVACPMNCSWISPSTRKRRIVRHEPICPVVTPRQQQQQQ